MISQFVAILISSSLFVAEGTELARRDISSAANVESNKAVDELLPEGMADEKEVGGRGMDSSLITRRMDDLEARMEKIEVTSLKNDQKNTNFDKVGYGTDNSKLADDRYGTDYSKLADDRYGTDYSKLADDRYGTDNSKLADEGYDTDNAKLADEGYEIGNSKVVQDGYGIEKPVKRTQWGAAKNCDRRRISRRCRLLLLGGRKIKICTYKQLKNSCATLANGRKDEISAV